MNTLIKYTCFGMMLGVLLSCNNKELCFNHFEHASRYATDVAITYHRYWEQAYENNTDWSARWSSLGLGFAYDDLRPEIPEGVRLTSFNAAGVRTDINIEPMGEEVYLSPGLNSLLFYNNDTEYIVFNDMGSYGQASATTRSRSRSTYTGNPYYKPIDGSRNEETVSAPDMLYGHYIDAYEQERVTTPQPLGVAMRPLVFTYVVCYRFEHGFDYVALARGALSGMAGAVYLRNGRTSDEAVTVLYDCTLEPWGVQAIVRSFGIPDFPNPLYSRAERTYALNLEVRLHNGKILNFNYDITDQVSIQPYGGVIEVDGIDIPDEIGQSGNSAFDVTVDGWGEFEDLQIEF